MDGQMSIFDYPDIVPDSLKELDPPEFDESIKNGIKGISDLNGKIPEYLIELKNKTGYGQKFAVAQWLGYWHLLSDSGNKLDMKYILSYKEFRIETLTIEELKDIMEKTTGLKYKFDTFGNSNSINAKYKGWDFICYIGEFKDGVKYVGFNKQSNGSGTGFPSTTVGGGALSFLWKMSQINICNKSGHKCNKEELWKIADTLDDVKCMHYCCARCNQKLCGARCNGAE